MEQKNKGQKRQGDEMLTPTPLPRVDSWLLPPPLVEPSLQHMSALLIENLTVAEPD